MSDNGLCLLQNVTRDDMRNMEIFNLTDLEGAIMKYVVNVNDKQPDEDKRSLRYAVKNRKSEILRDTYYLIDPENSPSKNLTMGFTVIYPTGKTTGHAHSDMEEVYYILSGRGKMAIGEDEFPIKAGDALYVPFGEYHVTFNTGNEPMAMVWVTGRDRSLAK
jgi:mannose-6-phosphate isomerase-like protein (cupin superfamily)